MRILQFFLHLFEKPTKRSVLNAAFCHLLNGILIIVVALFLLSPTPPGSEPLGFSVVLITAFVTFSLSDWLWDQAKHWLHPKESHHRFHDRHPF